MTGADRQQSEALLALLHEAQIPFVVVGGVAAVAHGSSLFTGDLAIVIPMEPALIDRLLEALAPYHPKHALRPDLGPIVQDGEALAGFRMLIDCDLSRLDVIAEVPPVGRHGDLRTIAVPAAGRHLTARLHPNEHEVVTMLVADDLVLIPVLGREQVLLGKRLVQARDGSSRSAGRTP